MEDSILLRKNLLDLDMQKYLQLASTSIIIGFSYFVGVFIITTTNQIDFMNSNIYKLFIVTTVFILGYTSIWFFLAFKKIQRISKAIRKMLKESNSN